MRVFVRFLRSTAVDAMVDAHERLYLHPLNSCPKNP
jgi:hypothetical protein